MKKVALLGLLLAAACSCVLACEPATGALDHPAGGRIARPFGLVKNRILPKTRLHTGIDYEGASGDSVRASDNGAVAEAKVEGAYGNYVRIDHGKGLQTAYAHLLTIEVMAGDCVRRGQMIGRIGSTGLAAVPHLHFEVLQAGRFIDPTPLLPPKD